MIIQIKKKMKKTNKVVMILAIIAGVILIGSYAVRAQDCKYSYNIEKEYNVKTTVEVCDTMQVVEYTLYDLNDCDTRKFNRIHNHINQHLITIEMVCYRENRRWL